MFESISLNYRRGEEEDGKGIDDAMKRMMNNNKLVPVNSE